MDPIGRLLTYGLVAAAVSGVLGILSCPRTAKKGEVRLSRFLMVLGIAAAAFFLVPAIITLFSGEQLWVSLLFLGFALLGGVLIIAFINCRISYDEEGFVAKKFFGTNIKATYEQVGGIKENLHETYIYVGKRRFMVDEFSVGGKEFINLVKRKYMTSHDGEFLPKIQNSKTDIFKGNLNNPTEFLVIYILFTVLFLGLLIGIFCLTCMPENENNTQEQTLCLLSCEVEEEDVVLLSEAGETYKLPLAAVRSNIGDIIELCSKGAVVTAYSTKISPDDGREYYSVKALKYEGEYLVSFKETNKVDSKEGRIAVAVIFVLFLMWVINVILSVAIARNPHRYSKKFIRFFFKDGYIKY